MSITANEHLEVVRLVLELGYRNDHSADTMHELVAEDYTSTGPMGGMDGRAALAAWGVKRVTNPSQVRHVLSNVRVFEDDGVLGATSYYVAFRDSAPTRPSRRAWGSTTTRSPASMARSSSPRAGSSPSS